MNGDPYRGNQSAAQPASRATRVAPEETRVEAPRAAAPRSRSERYDDEPRSKKGLWVTLSIILIVIILGVVGWFVWSNSKSGVTGIDSSRYQAVFLSNGQIYFGKLTAFNDDSYKITHVYYPQAESTSTDSTDTTTTDVNSSTSNIQLYKITDGVHGPDDEMIVMKDQVLYYENLKADSKVTQLIEQNK